MEQKETTIIEKKRDKIRSLKEDGIDLFPGSATISHTVADALAAIDRGEISDAGESPKLEMAGRIMALNSFGKSAFIRFRDRTGMLQAYLQKNKLGETAYALFKQMDIGDFVGLKGTLFQTKTGEWTLLADDIKLLCKAVRPLPEKFHGLKDPEKRYRQRYLDLIMNAGTRDIFIKRSRIIQAIRTFLLDRNFLEVETPMMQPIPGGAEARPFVTHHNALNMDLFLRIAPELYLKRLVVGGFERVFEINRNFRNEGISTRHNPEFTMLEFYQAYADYRHLMAMTEDLFAHVVSTTCGTMTVDYQGNTIDFAKPWRQMTLTDAMRDVAGIDEAALKDQPALLKVADEKGVKITKTDNKGKILTKLFDALVEPTLIAPTFITGYPVEVSPLSRTNAENNEIVDRFELFIAGNEIANGFSELNDPEEQKARFLAQVDARAAGDDEAHYMDEDYVEALEYGLPPTAGEGIGIDRLVMLLTDAASIREVILFPHMRPEGGK